MQEIRRDDGELCGYVAPRGGAWRALTVFGGMIGDCADEADAQSLVRGRGLAALAERWELRARCDDEWQIVCIQEANPHHVRLALGYYSLPGTPTREVSVEDLRSGEFELRLRD